jgi:hypothetical protein
MSDMMPGPIQGRLLVPAQAGANRVQITFVRTWDRTADGWISLRAIVLVLVLLKTVAPASRRAVGQDALPYCPDPAEGTAAETAALPES